MTAPQVVPFPTVRWLINAAIVLYLIMAVLVFIFGVFAWLFAHGSDFVDTVVRGSLLWPAHFLGVIR
jgi:hypothetical protein